MALDDNDKQWIEERLRLFAESLMESMTAHMRDVRDEVLRGVGSDQFGQDPE
jgi:hypothetical protein